MSAGDFGNMMPWARTRFGAHSPTLSRCIHINICLLLLFVVVVVVVVLVSCAEALPARP